MAAGCRSRARRAKVPATLHFPLYDEQRTRTNDKREQQRQRQQQKQQHRQQLLSGARQQRSAEGKSASNRKK